MDAMEGAPIRELPACYEFREGRGKGMGQGLSDQVAMMLHLCDDDPITDYLRVVKRRWLKRIVKRI
jgi:hypothetical protein